jgi:hypothetical protein
VTSLAKGRKKSDMVDGVDLAPQSVNWSAPCGVGVGVQAALSAIESSGGGALRFYWRRVFARHTKPQREQQHNGLR